MFKTHKSDPSHVVDAIRGLLEGAFLPRNNLLGQLDLLTTDRFAVYAAIC